MFFVLLVLVIFILYCTIVYGLVQMSIACSELYLHRNLAHESVGLDWRVILFCHLHLALFSGISPIKWMWQHLWHHSRVDTKDDLFSPTHNGKWRVFFFVLWYYNRGTKKHRKIFERFAARQQRNWVHEFQDYVPFGLGGLLLLCFAFGVPFGMLGISFGVAVWLGHMLCFALYWGYVTSITHSAPREWRVRVGRAWDVPMGEFLDFITMGGARNHEAHHEDAKQVNFAWKVKGLDPMYRIILFLEKHDLATVTR